MELDELEAGLYELGHAIRNARYAKEYGQKEELKECRLQINTVLDLLSDAHCHISIFEEKYYKQEDGTWWRRKYELYDYCTGDTVYYAELTISLVVDGTSGHIKVEKGDVALDLRHVRNADDTYEEPGDEPNKEIETPRHEPELTKKENEEFLKFLRDAGVPLDRKDKEDVP